MYGLNVPLTPEQKRLQRIRRVRVSYVYAESEILYVQITMGLIFIFCGFLFAVFVLVRLNTYVFDLIRPNYTALIAMSVFLFIVYVVIIGLYVRSPDDFASTSGGLAALIAYTVTIGWVLAWFTAFFNLWIMSEVFLLFTIVSLIILFSTIPCRTGAIHGQTISYAYKARPTLLVVMVITIAFAAGIAFTYYAMTTQTIADFLTSLTALLICGPYMVYELSSLCLDREQALKNIRELETDTKVFDAKGQEVLTGKTKFYDYTGKEVLKGNSNVFDDKGNEVPGYCGQNSGMGVANEAFMAAVILEINVLAVFRYLPQCCMDCCRMCC